ncbi:MAG: hypothetical protein ACKVP7_13975 [Hyphomicrobiaceae bacterium]
MTNVTPLHRTPDAQPDSAHAIVARKLLEDCLGIAALARDKYPSVYKATWLAEIADAEWDTEALAKVYDEINVEVRGIQDDRRSNRWGVVAIVVTFGAPAIFFLALASPGFRRLFWFLA